MITNLCNIFFAKLTCLLYSNIAMYVCLQPAARPFWQLIKVLFCLPDSHRNNKKGPKISCVCRYRKPVSYTHLTLPTTPYV